MTALNETRTEATERSLMDDNTRELLLSACCCISLEPPVAYVNHTKALVARSPTSVWADRPEDRRQGAQCGHESKAGRRYQDGRAGGRLGLGET
jgi:hypothetical protein